MKKALIALLLALPFVSASAQGSVPVAGDTVKVKRLQLKKADMVPAKAIIPGGEKATEKSEKPAEARKAAPAGPAAVAASGKATFPGGEKAIRDFVRKNVRYPEECRQDRVAGRVIVAITVRPDGTLSGFTIQRSSGNKYMDSEALRVARLMPAWTPAKDKKEGTEFKYMLNVSFRPGR